MIGTWLQKLTLPLPHGRGSVIPSEPTAEKITRRQLAGVAAGSVAAASLSAQQPAADAELEKARASHRENSATLAKFDIPQSTEPAFVFRP